MASVAIFGKVAVVGSAELCEPKCQARKTCGFTKLGSQESLTAQPLESIMSLVLSRQTDLSVPLPAAAEFLSDCRLRQLSPTTLQ